MSNHRRRNARPAGLPGPRRGGRRPPETGADWLWGWHPVVAALENPARETPARLIASPERALALAARLPAILAAEVMALADIGRLLPAGAVHQGLALKTPPPAPASLEALGTPAGGLLVMLDQVTDPHNVGAVFRNAAAFGARGVILQHRHAPALGGALAKAAAGAIERVGHARVVNLARALEQLEAMGWRAIGLDAAAPLTLAEVLDERPTVLVFGAENSGMRRLVAEHCDAAARIGMAAGVDSLNVAAAAAVALYEATRPRG